MEWAEDTIPLYASHHYVQETYPHPKLVERIYRYHKVQVPEPYGHDSCDLRETDFEVPA